MITFSDLTILLLGFTVLWHTTVKSPMEPAPAQTARPAEPPAQSLPVAKTMERELGKLCKTTCPSSSVPRD